jgi:hypothetical protein
MPFGRVFIGRLTFQVWQGNTEGMSNKEVVSDLLTRLPDDVSLQQITSEIQFIIGVREGLDQLDRGEVVAIEQVEEMIKSWTTK